MTSQYLECPCCGDDGAERAHAIVFHILEALTVILRGFELGIFQRNTDDDVNPGLAMRLMPYVAALAKGQQAIAKAEASPSSTGWQKIASAPKDGTDVLIWGPQGKPTIAHWWDGNFQNVSGWWYNARVFYPTHWMPLPSSPLAGQEREP